MAKQAQTNQQIANVVVTNVNVTNASANGIQTPQPQQPTTNANTIPQDITTMSDNDLISYINPSCFDQGKQTILAGKPFYFSLAHDIRGPLKLCLFKKSNQHKTISFYSLIQMPKKCQGITQIECRRSEDKTMIMMP